MSRLIVVTGANGVQGAALVGRFREAGWRVRGVTRGGTGPLPGVEYAAADLADADALARAFAGADAVVYTSPIDHRPGARERAAEAVTRAAAAAGVGRLVLNTAGPVPDGLAAADPLRAASATVLAGVTPAVILRPTVFMDNLRAPWSLPGIRAGTFAYPLPADEPVSWASHRTLAECAVAAAGAPGVTGRTFDIGAPPVTARRIAELLSERLGRPVAFASVPLDAFAAGLNAAYGPPAGDDIAALYRHAAAHPDGLVRDPAGLAPLGVRPETFAEFVARSDW